MTVLCNGRGGARHNGTGALAQEGADGARAVRLGRAGDGRHARRVPLRRHVRQRAQERQHAHRGRHAARDGAERRRHVPAALAHVPRPREHERHSGADALVRRARVRAVLPEGQPDAARRQRPGAPARPATGTGVYGYGTSSTQQQDALIAQGKSIN